MKMICMGSINMDIVYQVAHIPQGGETISALDRNVFWGGKGLNQAVALAKGFDQVYMAGFVNQADANVIEYMQGHHLKTDFVSLSEKPSGHAIIYVDEGGQNSITIFGGSNRDFSPSYIERVLAQFEAGDILLLQNEINHLEHIIHTAHARGIQIALNPSPWEKALLSLPLEKITYFLYNEIEATQIAGRDSFDDEMEILNLLADKYPQATHVLTMGSQGVLCKAGDKIYRHGVYKVEAVDTTAAGDTFTGFFLSQLACGSDIPTALETASKAAAIAVSRAGATVSIPSLAEVAAAVIEYRPHIV